MSWKEHPCRTCSISGCWKFVSLECVLRQILTISDSGFSSLNTKLQHSAPHALPSTLQILLSESQLFQGSQEGRLRRGLQETWLSLCYGALICSFDFRLPPCYKPNLRDLAGPPKVCQIIAQSHQKQPKRPLFYILLENSEGFLSRLPTAGEASLQNSQAFS